MWVIKEAPFSTDDSRVKMWATGIKEAKSYGWIDSKDGEWVLTNRGRIAKIVFGTKYNNGTESDLKANAMKEHLRGHSNHPGPNPGFQTWPFTEMVKYMGFYAAMAKAIEYNGTIETTRCGEEFLMYFKTHYLFECPDGSFKTPARGEEAGYCDGVHFRAWEIEMESKGYSGGNGKIVKKYLIE